MTAGPLLIVGGREDRSGDLVVLRRFVELAGGTAEARLLVVGTATTVPEELDAEYVHAFRTIGVSDVEELPLASRAEASTDEAVEAVERATGVYFVGGDQMRIAGILGGTAFDVALRAAWEQGTAVGGTSAGAAMMSSTMILGGHDTVPSLEAVRLGPGLGFLEGVVVDMHFAERGRLSRLLAAVAQFPHELGLGIDENTAVAVTGDRFEVVGSGAVTVVDAGPVTSLHLPTGDGPIALTGALLHVLPAGYSFDLATRTPVVVVAPEHAIAR